MYFDQITQTLKRADIAIEGLFINADAVFLEIPFFFSSDLGEDNKNVLKPSDIARKL
ncbi:hypothetical protein [Chryseobacterium elymi]|uniref:hypothetical protein n=1 Tax=Chryseobacterium elymi TaxID=395936 RepID=UPI0013008F6D|nr:hypothetical protein [Chryseobacterium elymi]